MSQLSMWPDESRGAPAAPEARQRPEGPWAARAEPDSSLEEAQLFLWSRQCTC